MINDENKVEGSAAFEELLKLYAEDFGRVLKVYRGRSDRCYCGCSGTYFDTSLETLGTSQVSNDRGARSRLAEMVKRSGLGATTVGFDGFEGERLITVEYAENMALTVYFKKAN